MSVNIPIKRRLDALRGALPTLLVVGFFINVLALTSPIYMIQLYDRVLSSMQVQTLFVITILAGLALAVFGILEAIRGYMVNRLGCWLEAEISPIVVRKTLEATLNEDIRASAFLDDVSDIRNFVAAPLRTLLDLPFSPIFFAAAFLLHPMIGWMTIGSAAILFIIAIMNDRATRGAAREFASIFHDGQKIVDHGLRNAETVKALGMGSFLVDRWKTKLRQAQEMQVQAADYAASFIGLTKFVRMFAQALVLGAGALLVIRGEISVGLIIAGSIILGRALAPIDQSLSSWHSLNKAREAYRRLVALDTRYQDMPSDTAQMIRPKGHLSLQHVQYVAPSTRAQILKDISFSVRPSEVLAIVGPSGAGKSTIAKILVGARSASAGDVMLDGIDLAHWDREVLGASTGYLPQSIELFAGTIAENIARMSQDIEPNTLMEAIDAAGIDGLVKRLPKGVDTQIAHGGGFLSGGQRQRIGLARAFYDRPPLIVLDEPNAHLDAEGEKSLIDAIKKAKEWGSSVVLACHTPSLLEVADVILIVVQGEVQVFGPAEKIRPIIMEKLAPVGPNRLALEA